MPICCSEYEPSDIVMVSAVFRHYLSKRMVKLSTSCPLLSSELGHGLLVESL